MATFVRNWPLWLCKNRQIWSHCKGQHSLGPIITITSGEIDSMKILITLLTIVHLSCSDEILCPSLDTITTSANLPLKQCSHWSVLRSKLSRSRRPKILYILKEQASLLSKTHQCQFVSYGARHIYLKLVIQ